MLSTQGAGPRLPAVAFAVVRARIEHDCSGTERGGLRVTKFHAFSHLPCFYSCDAAWAPWAPRALPHGQLVFDTGPLQQCCALATS